MLDVTLEIAEATPYDVVIVGGGVCGALTAKRLWQENRSVLILEAGTGQGSTYEGYQDFLETYYTQEAKIPQSPYPTVANAPQPTELEPRKWDGKPATNGYFVQNGPLPYRSTYTRYLGGTTLHWLGTSLRMLPEDFEMKCRFGVGANWPIGYDALAPHYADAEYELGTSANVDEQRYGGVHFPAGYVYPMHGLPPSWGDLCLARAIDGKPVRLPGETRELRVVGTPASRNGIPNPDYDDKRGYRPVGAADNPAQGNRCMGNSSCVPICPIQAKYNALKTLASIPGEARVHRLTQAVASRLCIDPDSGRVTGIECKHYAAPGVPEYKTFTARGTAFVLAAHAVENAKLMLASGAARESSALGRNLMDHTELLTWGLAPQPVWPFRGPVATSGIEVARYGEFRRHTAAFRIEIGNDGWSWPEFSPGSDVNRLVDNLGRAGKRLRRELCDLVSRQVRFGILVEQLPEAANRVTIDPAYRDALGNFRPLISFDIADYTRAGFALARRVSDDIFDLAGIENHSSYPKDDPGWFEYEEKGYFFQGAGHYMGTHRMGLCGKDSVVDARQRCWEHPNLYLVGCGNMVTSATSNPTLTAAALTLMAAKHLAQDLKTGIR